MTRFQRLALIAGGFTAALFAALGLASAGELDTPDAKPGPKPKVPPKMPPASPPGGGPTEPPPTTPIFTPPDTAPTTPPDTVPSDTPGGGTVPAVPTPIFTPNIPILPDPVEPEIPETPAQSATWIGRHAKLKQAGYWPFTASKPVSGDTVEAIQMFQAQTEAARNVLQGANMGAAELSGQYGVIVPDGKWGPVTAQWLDWAIANKGLHAQAVFAQTGKPAGWAG